MADASAVECASAMKQLWRQAFETAANDIDEIPFGYVEDNGVTTNSPDLFLLGLNLSQKSECKPWECENHGYALFMQIRKLLRAELNQIIVYKQFDEKRVVYEGTC